MKNKKVLFLLLFMPLLVRAESELGYIPSLFVCGFLTVFHYLMIIMPISIFLKKENYKNLSITITILRIIVVPFIYNEFSMYFLIDFMLVFFPGIILNAISQEYAKKIGINAYGKKSKSSNKPQIEFIKTDNENYKCSYCGTIVKSTDNFCNGCGKPISEILKTVDENKVLAKEEDYNPLFKLTEDEMLKKIIEKKLADAGIPSNTKLMPISECKRKKILNLLFSILLCLYISLIFFHFSFLVYIFVLIILIVFFILINNFDFKDYLIKQIKARPSEKISNIIMNLKVNLVVDNTKSILLFGIIIAILLPCIIFFKPRIFYEELDNGYSIRFYTLGITNNKVVNIPSTHNGKEVISIRGDVFSNMFFLESVTLPDTITEIRGKAFYNDINLKSINIPNSLSEIKGNTFENCKSLEEITIPSTVTRIGGHAFYGCSSLKRVEINSDSNLQEIGSSAFRRCSSLYSITIPRSTNVNSKAFKESPTTIHYFEDEYDYLNY